MKPLAVVLLMGIVVAVALVFTARWHNRTTAPSEEPIRLVSQESAVSRALCLGAVVSRACVFEDGVDAAREQSPEAVKTVLAALDGECAKTNPRLKSEGIWDALSSRERTILEKGLGEWTRQELIDAHWRTEALGVMEWALHVRGSMPAYDQPFDSAEVVRALDMRGHSSGFRAKCHLRSIDEIEKARDVAELWLWRARTTQLQKDDTAPPKGHAFERVIAITAKKAGQDGLFAPIDSDFPAFGKAYSRLTDDEWSLMGSIAKERLYALNWLCGYAPDWDEVPTDT